MPSIWILDLGTKLWTTTDYCMNYELLLSTIPDLALLLSSLEEKCLTKLQKLYSFFFFKRKMQHSPPDPNERCALKWKDDRETYPSFSFSGNLLRNHPPPSPPPNFQFGIRIFSYCPHSSILMTFFFFFSMFYYLCFFLS